MSSHIEETAAAAIDEMDQIVAATRNMADVVVARTNLRLQAAVLVLSVAVIALTVVQIVVALND
jgi:acetamidase/formamidase